MRVSADRFIRYLSERGVSTASELASALKISQPTVSRLIQRSSREVLSIGKSRATRYAVRRRIPEAGTAVTLYEIEADGRSIERAVVHAILPRGFHVESRWDEMESRVHDDLPYFLDGLRPSGFLGRLIPRRHPELELPEDIRSWTADHCLQYLVRLGWDMPGSYIAGEPALELWLAHAREAPDRVDLADRVARYPEIVSHLLAGSVPGSSAGGEQPKFLATVVPTAQPVLVKFSPDAGSPIGRRWADLLAAEHLGHEVLRHHGVRTPPSELLESRGQFFLQVDRFDRLPGGGRRSVLSLFAIDCEFVGGLRSWSATARSLHDQRRIDGETLRRIRWLELFGHLIGNSDMHPSNLSFHMRGERLLEMTPVYDMLPMYYAPQHETLPTALHQAPAPAAQHAGVWPSALAAAREFWDRISGCERVSGDFRAIAKSNLSSLDAWETLARRLPA